MEAHDLYRYPGFRPFQDTEFDRKLFWGREQETATLLHTVLSEPLVVLYAKSGIGKSSLLHAGLFPVLREREFLPLPVRFNTPDLSPLEAIYSGICSVIELQQMEWTSGHKQTLWQYFKTAEFWSPGYALLTPVLIFDQFEEFFAMYSLEQRQQFTTQLADLVEGRIPQKLRIALDSEIEFPYTETPPRVKLIISLREESLGQLDEMLSSIPNVLHNRIRLLPLNQEQARQAIIMPAQLEEGEFLTPPFHYTEETIQVILDFLRKQHEGNGEILTNEIESFQLQLVCQHIERKVLTGFHHTDKNIAVYPDMTGGEKGMQKVMETFYDALIEEFDPASRTRIRKLCEQGLISSSQRRLLLEQEEIERRFTISPQVLSELINRRLLRPEHRLGSVYYELSHDTLVKPIRTSQEKRHAKTLKYQRVFQVGIGVLLFLLFMSFDTYLKRAYYLSLANALSQQGEYEEAIKGFDVMLRNEPDNVEVRIRLADVFLTQERYDGAIHHYKEALDIDQSAGKDVYLKLGHAYAGADRHDDAIRAYTTAMSLTPGDFRVYYGLADVYFEREEYGLAISFYKKASQRSPKNAVLINKLGDAYLRRGRAVEAIDTFRISLDISADNPEAYRGLGDAFFQQKKYEQAFEAYQEAIGRDNECSTAYKGLGDVLFVRKFYPEAMENYQTALRLNPDDMSVYQKFGDILFMQEHYKRALDNYQKSLEKFTTDSELYLAAGNAYFALGDDEAARENYIQAWYFAPFDPKISLHLAEVSLLLENFYQTLGQTEIEMKNVNHFTLPEDILVMRFLNLTAFFFIQNEDKAFDEVQEFTQYYLSLSEDFEKTWRWERMLTLINTTSKLSDSNKELLRKLIHMMTSPVLQTKLGSRDLLSIRE